MKQIQWLQNKTWPCGYSKWVSKKHLHYDCFNGWKNVLKSITPTQCPSQEVLPLILCPQSVTRNISDLIRWARNHPVRWFHGRNKYSFNLKCNDNLYKPPPSFFSLFNLLASFFQPEQLKIPRKHEEVIIYSDIRLYLKNDIFCPAPGYDLDLTDILKSKIKRMSIMQSIFLLN